MRPGLSGVRGPLLPRPVLGRGRRLPGRRDVAPVASPVMTIRLYAHANYEDGRRLEALFVGDQVGLRMYASGPSGIEEVGEWRGADIRDRRDSGRHVIELSGIDDPLPFTLEYWGGCHCHHVLKRYRPPAWSPE